MNKLLSTLALLCAAAAAGAQTASTDHSHHPAASAPAATNAALDPGEVRKVDKAGKRLTIKHGAIKRLEMPPMTMAYVVKDTAWLDKLKPGDKIRFRAEKAPLGDYIVTELATDR